MTDDPSGASLKPDCGPTPPLGGQPQALTDNELDGLIATLMANGSLGEEDAVRLLATLDEARARAAYFGNLAIVQQATNEAMVASLKRGLAQLEVSEAEVARLRNVLINTRRNDGHWYGCWTNDGSSERCSPECALFAETLAATDRGRAPDDQERREGADDGE